MTHRASTGIRAGQVTMRGMETRLARLLKRTAEGLECVGVALGGVPSVSAQLRACEKELALSNPPAAHPERLVPLLPLLPEALWAGLADIDRPRRLRTLTRPRARWRRRS